MFRASVFISVVLTLSFAVAAQDHAEKIRGYKVFDAKVTVSNSPPLSAANDKIDAFVNLSAPTFAGLGLTAATVEIGAEVTATDQSGSVDFVTFQDAAINGVKVVVEEYRHPFSFKKLQPVAIPKPVRISLRFASLPQVLYSEIFERKSEISISGTAFVFGKFKKFGFSFKRVVPVKFDLKMKNPLSL